MKKLLLIFIITATPLALNAQSDQDEIRKTFDNYFQTLETKNSNETLEYIYPKVFEYYSKEVLLKGLNSLQGDENITVNLKDAKILDIKKVIEVNDNKYSLIKSSFIIDMHFSENLDSEVDVPAMTYEAYKERYGEKNVAYDPQSKKLNVKLTNEFYVIKDAGSSNWKFLDKSDAMKPVLEKILPEQVLALL